MNFVKFIRISYLLGIIKRIHEKIAFVSEETQYFEFVREDNIRLLTMQEPFKDPKDDRGRYNIELVNHIKNMSSVE